MTWSKLSVGPLCAERSWDGEDAQPSSRNFQTHEYDSGPDRDHFDDCAFQIHESRTS